jgi:hypothetical protein
MIANPGNRQILVRTPDGRLYSNALGFSIAAPPTPNYSYIGMFETTRRVGVAMVQDKNNRDILNVQRGDLLSGRFRVTSISEKELVLMDANLKIKHTLAMTEGDKSSSPMSRPTPTWPQKMTEPPRPPQYISRALRLVQSSRLISPGRGRLRLVTPWLRSLPDDGVDLVCHGCSASIHQQAVRERGRKPPWRQVADAIRGYYLFVVFKRVVKVIKRYLLDRSSCSKVCPSRWFKRTDKFFVPARRVIHLPLMVNGVLWPRSQTLIDFEEAVMLYAQNDTATSTPANAESHSYRRGEPVF